MSKQTEELKLALNKAFKLGQRYWSWADSEYSSHWKKADAAKAEFDQLVQDTINAALAEQPAQQEPGRNYYEDGDVFERIAAMKKQPAQRKPLTDEQIDKLPWGPHEGNPVTFAEGLRDFARAIEAAHGIKGDA